MAKIAISARIDERILIKAKQTAKKQNRSFNNVLETSLMSYCYKEDEAAH